MDEWYSAMLNFVVEVEGEPEVRRSRSVILVRGPESDFDGTKALAIKRGRSMEKDYLNSAGKRVRWTLEDVETIDLLGTDLADGREVYHEFSDYFARDRLLPPLDPDASVPTQSGV